MILMALYCLLDATLPPLEWTHFLPPLYVCDQALSRNDSYHRRIIDQIKLQPYRKDLRWLRQDAEAREAAWHMAAAAQEPMNCVMYRRLLLWHLMDYLGWDSVTDLITRPLPLYRPLEGP